MTENHGGERQAAPRDWQDWQRWVEDVDWSDWRSWLQRVASTDWTAGPWLATPMGKGAPLQAKSRSRCGPSRKASLVA